MKRPTLVRLAIFAATVVAVAGVLSLGSAEAEETLVIGEVAGRDYIAQRSAEVIDEQATAIAQQQARDAIAPIKETNTEVEDAVNGSINAVFDDVTTLVAGDQPVRTPATPPELPGGDAANTDDPAATRIGSEPSLITGVVFLDANNDGVYNPSAEGTRVDAGLGNVTVQIRTEDGPTQLRTDADGVWSFELETGAAVVAYDPADAAIPLGWIFGATDETVLLECGPGQRCQAAEVPIVTNLRPLAEVEVALGAQYNLPAQTLSYLAETASEDIVRGPLGEELHLRVVRDAALDRALREFGRRIEPDQLNDVQNSVRSSPLLVFHNDTGQDVPGGQAAGEIVAFFLQANFLINEERTTEEQDMAAAEIPTAMAAFVEGQKIVDQGDVFTQLDIDAIEATQLLVVAERASLGLLAVVAVLIAVVGFYLVRFRPEFWLRPRMVSLLGMLMFLAAASVKAAVLFHEATSWYLLPAVAFGFVTAILFDQRIGVLMALTVGVLTAVGTLDVEITVYAALAAVAPIPFVSSVSTRGAFRSAVAWSALTAAGIAAATSWFFGAGPNDAVWAFAAIEVPYQVIAEAAGWSFGVSILASLVGLAALQFFEAAFDITTTLSLLDLTDRNHKALQHLQEKAFGTFNHSLMVGTLADAAARSIGADPLLARAMAYYHDLGKTENPTYFIENQFGIPNPHDALDPRESASIIRSHVTSGVALARRFKIPTDVAQGIVSHHGDGVMRFFYEKAREIHGPDVEIDDFRHTGHKPGTEETAILMLSDSLEAACRAVFQHEEPSPDAIEKVVNRIMDEKIEDGQLSESPLTLAEMTKIRQAFLDSLVGHYHQRIAYPSFPGS